jgi:hypothetical protein
MTRRTSSFPFSPLYPLLSSLLTSLLLISYNTYSLLCLTSITEITQSQKSLNHQGFGFANYNSTGNITETRFYHHPRSPGSPGLRGLELSIRLYPSSASSVFPTFPPRRHIFGPRVGLGFTNLKKPRFCFFLLVILLVVWASLASPGVWLPWQRCPAWLVRPTKTVHSGQPYDNLSWAGWLAGWRPSNPSWAPPAKLSYLQPPRNLSPSPLAVPPGPPGVFIKPTDSRQTCLVPTRHIIPYR